MPEGIEVFVDEGFATIGVPDKTKRAEVLNAILEHTPNAFIEKLTRSGPFVLYRIPEGNARDAGLIDGEHSTPPLDRVDLGHGQRLVDADPKLDSPTDGHGEWRSPQSTVKGNAYGAAPSVTGPVTQSDVNNPEPNHDVNGHISGPLRPNKPVSDFVPPPPAIADIGSADLQQLVADNTPNPADYAPERVARDERVPAVVGTIAAVVREERSGVTAAGDADEAVVVSPADSAIPSVVEEPVEESKPPVKKAAARKAPAKKAAPKPSAS